MAVSAAFASKPANTNIPKGGLTVRLFVIIKTSIGGVSMTIDALIPTLRELSRAEKIRAIQFLASELEKDETLMLQPGKEYAIWSPYDAYEAANQLQQLLDEHNQSSDRD
jgi:hypothetical protein